MGFKRFFLGSSSAPVPRRVRGQGSSVVTASLSAKVTRADGRVENRGVVSRRVVTDAFVNFLVDQLQAESSEIGDFKYHDSGQGTNAESNTDTALQSACGIARATGTQTEGASANIYKTVGEITYDGDYNVTEHGLFSQSTGGILADRSKFTAIGVGNGDKIEFTYELTASAGG